MWTLGLGEETRRSCFLWIRAQTRCANIPLEPEGQCLASSLSVSEVSQFPPHWANLALHLFALTLPCRKLSPRASP